MLNSYRRFSFQFWIAGVAMAVVGMLSLSAARSLSFEELYDSTKLLDVKITVDESDWDEIRTQSRSMAQALGEARRYGKPESPFHYVTADVTINGVLFKSVGIRKKGFIGSLDDTRPSLKVKFNHTDEDASVAGLTQLTLNNNKQDRALVSQSMAYALFNQVGLPAPRTSYAKVTVNGESLGVYTNVESARKPLVKRGFGDDGGTLFEGTIVDFFKGWASGFEHKFGPEESGRAKIESVIKALDGPDDAMLEAVSQVVELDAFLKFWAVESLIGFWDGYAGNQNNFFVYLNPKTDKLHFLPWGADSVFTSRGMFDRGGPQSVKARGRLASRLYELPDIRTRYRSVMLGLLESDWNEASLRKESERIEALVGDHLHAAQQGFRSELDRTRSFFESRREQLKGELRDGPPSLEGGASEPMYFAKVGRIEGEIAGRWFDNEPADATELGKANLKVSMEGKEVAFAHLGVHAIMGRFGFRGPGQPNINIVGERASDGERVTLMLMVQERQFAPTGDARVSVGGMMREGNGFGFGPGGMRPIDGKIQIIEASREEGAPVKAIVSADIMKMVGGFFGRGRGGGPPRGPGRGPEGRGGRGPRPPRPR